MNDPRAQAAFYAFCGGFNVGCLFLGGEWWWIPLHLFVAAFCYAETRKRVRRAEA